VVFLGRKSQIFVLSAQVDKLELGLDLHPIPVTKSRESLKNQQN